MRPRFGPLLAQFEARYLKINKLCEKWAENAVFQKYFLTDFPIPFTFGVPQSYPGAAGILTERKEAEVRHEDKSQVGKMPRRTGLAVCLFARLY